jgi:hypothetical protein
VIRIGASLPTYRIEDVPLSEACKYWIQPKALLQADQILSGPCTPQNWLGYWSAVSKMRMAIWSMCLTGQLTVAAREGGSLPSVTKTYPVELVRMFKAMNYENNTALLDEIPLHDLRVSGPLPSRFYVYEDPFFDHVAEFQQERMYRRVIMRGRKFTLGKTPARIVHILHYAATQGEPYCYEEDLLYAVGAKGSIRDHFKRIPNWEELIKRTGVGCWALNVQRPLHPFRYEKLNRITRDRAPYVIKRSGFSLVPESD